MSLRTVVITGLMALAGGSPLPALAGDLDINWERAEKNYMLHCQGCHRADATGSGDTVPDMNGMLGKFLQVPGGREFIGRVPGVANAPINDKELAELVNWLLVTLNKEELGQSFKPYTPVEIGELRQRVLVSDVFQVREGLVQKIAKLK